MSTDHLDRPVPDPSPVSRPTTPGSRDGWGKRLLARAPAAILFLLVAALVVWGFRTEWTFANPFSGRPAAKEKEKDDHGAEVTPGPGAKEPGGCPLHGTRIKLPSPDVARDIGLTVVPVGSRPLAATITAPAELEYDQTRVARLSALVPGTVVRVDKQVGDPVRRGDIVAVVDAAQVGKAKADFLDALAQLDLQEATLEKLKATGEAAVSAQRIREAEAAVRAGRIRVQSTQQALVNLGLTVDPAEFRKIAPEEQGRRIRRLGLPPEYAKALDAQGDSTNLLPVVARTDGVVAERNVVPGEVVDPSKVLFVVADLTRIWVMADVRADDADQVAVGQAVTFRADGHPDEALVGKVSWTSTTIDPRTRTLRVRAEIENPKGHWRARTFGTAKIRLRDPNAAALVVPADAVQQEGKCRYVFVRVAEATYEMRAVKLGVRGLKELEVVEGVRPGEAVVAAGSFVLKAEILKDRLGGGD